MASSAKEIQRLKADVQAMRNNTKAAAEARIAQLDSTLKATASSTSEPENAESLEEQEHRLLRDLTVAMHDLNSSCKNAERSHNFELEDVDQLLGKWDAALRQKCDELDQYKLDVQAFKSLNIFSGK